MLVGVSVRVTVGVCVGVSVKVGVGVGIGTNSVNSQHWIPVPPGSPAPVNVKVVNGLEVTISKYPAPASKLQDVDKNVVGPA